MDVMSETTAIYPQRTLPMGARPDANKLQGGRSAPIDVLDGVDKGHARELRACGITDVQNMASANPIQLLLQTSFGLYQILDWMDQALLVTAVGWEHANRLRLLGVRTASNLIELGRYSDNAMASRVSQVLFEYDGTDSAIRHFTKIMEEDLHYKRISSLNTDAIALILGAIDFNKNDIYSFRYQQLSVLQRFSDQSPLILPLSIATLVGAGLEVWTNIQHTAHSILGMALPSAFAQTGATGSIVQQIATSPQNLRPIVACFLGAGIFMTLGVCLYSGFLAKKPSARAAEAVKGILSFSFGIVTGSLSGL
jgi:hypothetical protein